MMSRANLAFLFTTLSMVACGAGTEENTFNGTAQDVTQSSSSSGSSGASSGDFGTGGGSSGTPVTPPGDGGSCAAVSAEAKLQNVNLMILLDRSGSMVKDGKKDVKALKWTPVTSTLTTFLTDSTVTGMKASVTLFPEVGNTSSETNGNSCTVSYYQAPNGALAELPSTTLASVISGASPSGSGTPLRYALQGVITQATALATAHPEEKTVIVVATDGEPYGCTDNTVANTAADVAVVADKTPTYVIGVGSSLTSLNSIAASGGTTAAKIVTVGDPAATSAELLATLKQIRQDSISCDLTIPVPPDGRKIDANKVSVKSAGNVLSYSADCAVDGWHYDDPAKPTKVMLCANTCSTVRQSGQGLNVSFECEDKQVAVVR